MSTGAMTKPKPEPERFESIPVEQYLREEPERDPRCEYFDGEVIAMAGAGLPHEIIKMNLALTLQNHLQGSGCRVFTSDRKVNACNSKSKGYYYPDVLVSCRWRENQDLYTEDYPQIIIEISSESTEKIDRHLKKANYLQIPSLREYLVVSQREKAVEHYYRVADGWEYILLGEGNVLSLGSIELGLTMDQIYRDVDA